MAQPTTAVQAQVGRSFSEQAMALGNFRAAEEHLVQVLKTPQPAWAFWQARCELAWSQCWSGFDSFGEARAREYLFEAGRQGVPAIIPFTLHLALADRSRRAEAPRALQEELSACRQLLPTDPWPGQELHTFILDSFELSIGPTRDRLQLASFRERLARLDTRRSWTPIETRMFWQAVQLWERRLIPGQAFQLCGQLQSSLEFDLGRELTRLEVARSQRRLGLFEEASQTTYEARRRFPELLSRIHRERQRWQANGGDASLDWTAGDASRLEWRLFQELLRLRVAQDRITTGEDLRECAEFMGKASQAQHRCEQVQSWSPLDDMSWDTLFFAQYVEFEGWQQKCIQLLAATADQYRKLKHRPALALAMALHGQLLKEQQQWSQALASLQEATLQLESYLGELPGTGLSDLEFHHLHRGCYQDLAEVHSSLGNSQQALATLSRLQALESIERGPSSVQGLKPSDFDPAQLQPLLDDQTAIVQFLPGEQSLHLFLLTREGLQRYQSPLGRSQLDALIRKARGQLAQQGPLPQNELAELYRHLIAPLEPQLEGKNQLVIVPSGYLFYLPFAALGREEGDGWHYLIERIACVQLGKLSDARLLLRPPRTFQGPVVALGNPDGSLPAAADECIEIARMFPGSTSVTGQEIKLKDLRGLSRASYLHLATHAVLNSARPWESYLQLGPSSRLTMADVHVLPLDSTRLVTLSACQTALGVHLPGQEIASLAETFAAAGATSVLATLWRIPDEPTRDLMIDLYRRLSQGSSLGEALQQAQLQQLRQRDRAHPYFWASFSLLGDWR